MARNFSFERNQRRLPVYLVLDCSGSMAGEPITAMNQGIRLMWRELTMDPEALELVWLSIVTISEPVSITQLSQISDFSPLTLNAGGSSPIGSAFKALIYSIEHDTQQNTSTAHGDYRPLIFFLTDSHPADEYRLYLSHLKVLRDNRRPNIIAIGLSGASEKMLHEVTDTVFIMSHTRSTPIIDLFRWISETIIQVSRSIGRSGGDMPISLNAPTYIQGMIYSPPNA